MTNNSTTIYQKITGNIAVIVLVNIISAVIVFASLILLVLLFSMQVSVISQTSNYTGNSSVLVKILAHNKEIIESLRIIKNYVLLSSLAVIIISSIKMLIMPTKLKKINIFCIGIVVSLLILLSALYSEEVVRYFIHIAIK